MNNKYKAKTIKENMKLILRNAWSQSLDRYVKEGNIEFFIPIVDLDRINEYIDNVDEEYLLNMFYTVIES